MAELSWSEQRFTLEPPLVNARGRWTERQSLVLTLRDDAGRRGHGECAPLPGYSPDELDDAVTALVALPRLLIDELAAARDPRAVIDVVAHAVPSTLPALRFALETAALDRLGQERRLPLWQLLAELTGKPASSTGVELAALLPANDVETALAQARQLEAQGVRCFKLKLGPGIPSPTLLSTLVALRTELPEGIALRLDANASLDPNQLETTLRTLSAFDPELLEEPVDLTQLEPAVEATLARSRMPIALDESLRTLASLDAALESTWCDSVVLKPTTLGGLSRCLDLAGRAETRRRGVIVSHTFEGPVGWVACAHLALALAPTRAAGLWPQPGQCPAELELRLLRAGQLLPLERPGLGVAP